MVRMLIAWSKDASHRMDEANVRLYAAAIAYRTIFGVVAFLTTFVLVGYLLGIDPGDIEAGGRNLSGGTVEGIVTDKLSRTLQLSTSSIWIAGIIGFGIGLYGMSGGFAAVCDVLDRMHGTQRYVRMSKRYLRGAGIATMFVGLAIISVLLLSITRSVGDFMFGMLHLDQMSRFLEILLGVVVPCLTIMFAFGVVNRYGSHARPSWSRVVISAIVAGASWMLLFYGFIFVVAFTRPFEAYGALATSVALLIFGYMQGYILLLTNLFAYELALVVSYVPGLRKLSGERPQRATIGATNE